MPKLLKSVFADLKFTKCDKVKIENIVVLLELDERSKKFHNTSKRVSSSGDFQNLVIKTLDTKTISQSGNLRIFFIQIFHKTENFLFRIRIQLDA